MPILSYIAPIIGVLILLIGLILLPVSYQASKDKYNDGGSFWLGCVGLIFISFAVGMPSGELSEHLTDQIKISTNAELITIHQERITEMDRQLTDVKAQPTLTANSDSPVTALVKAKLELTQEIANAKLEHLYATRSIMKREIGYYYWIPRMYPMTM